MRQGRLAKAYEEKKGKKTPIDTKIHGENYRRKQRKKEVKKKY